MQRFERLKRRVVHALLALAGGAGGGRPERSFDDCNPAYERTSKTLTELIQLAWPIATAMLGETLLGLVDTKLVGGLGASALGGVGIGAMLMFLNYSIIFGVMRGVKVAAAHAVGRGAPQDGRRFATAGMIIGAFVGVLVWLAARDVTWLLVEIRIDPQLVPYARDFFAAVTFGAPATCVMAALVNHRQAVGDSRSPMVVGIAGNAVNALLSYALIYGKFGCPALGVRGGGFGTATTEWLEMLVLLTLHVRDARSSLRSSLTMRSAAREVLALGGPTGLQFAAELLAFATFTAILGNLGVAEVAAHQIAMATIRVSFLPGIAVSEASCVLVGRALGKRDVREADAVNRAAMFVAASFMAGCGLVFALLGSRIVSMFTEDAGVAYVARRLLLLAAAFQVVDAFNIVLRGSLRGAKDVRIAALIAVAVVWTCVPGAAFVLGKMAGWGAFGGWCGFLGETALGSLLLWIRWKRGAWRKEYAEETAQSAAPASLATSFG